MEAKKTYTCPRCGKEQDFAVVVGDGKPQCPSCGRLLSKNMVEEVRIEYKEKGETLRKEEKEYEEPVPEDNEEEKKAGAPPFKRIREPEEILDEIMSDYGLSQRTRSFIIKKSKRIGGIHPSSLRSFLEQMDEKISPIVIDSIVDDYYREIEKERRKAEELGMRMVYPLGGEPSPRFIPSFTGLQQTGYGLQTTPIQELQLATPIQRQSWQPTLSPELVARQVYEMLAREAKEKRTEERIHQLELELVKMRNETMKQLDEAVKKIQETISQTQVSTPPQPSVTLQEIQQLLDKREKDSYIKYLEERAKDEKEQREKDREAMEKMFQTLIAERQALSQKIEEEREKWARKLDEERKMWAKSVPPSTEGYTRDETRLLADALRILGDKSPVRDIGRIVIDFMEKGEKPPPKREKVGEEEITSYLPPELLAEE
ncbi:MAG: hypothetical protein QW356_04605 [Candidatus Hadarchaeales archaeon]